MTAATPAATGTGPGPGAPAGGRRRALVVVGAALVALVVVLVLLAPGRTSEGVLDPYSTAPGGTRAVVELARELGADVEIGSDLPGDDVDVAVLFEDVADGPAAAG